MRPRAYFRGDAESAFGRQATQAALGQSEGWVVLPGLRGAARPLWAQGRCATLP